MRYFLHLSYLGTAYCGWQRQPNAMTVQEKIEDVLSKILNTPTEITGCGRTDTGVHAMDYVAHFDFEGEIPVTFLRGINGMLPDDIAIRDISPVHATAHARFDAYERSYEYHIIGQKNPFKSRTAWYFAQADKLDWTQLQETAALYPQYDSFYPFCKSDSGLDHYRCQMKTAFWEKSTDGEGLVFHVTANRFLRGMVRLLVGACIQTATGKLRIEAVKKALDEQSSLPKSLSVPPQGLFLKGIKYPERPH